MATTNPSVARAYVASQDLYTITYPYSDIVGLAIAGVSKADPAIVTSQQSLTGQLVSGTAVAITNVGGMTQLKTHGENSSNKYYVDVTGENTFALYTDSTLTTSANSSSFTTATANTGTFQKFSVPQYNSVGSTATVVFNESGPEYGNKISVNTTTGIITVAGGLVYSFTATAEINVPGATYQWYEVTGGTPSALGSSAPVGTTLTTVWTPADPGDVALIVTAADGTTFSYPTKITNAQAVVQVASGFVA